VNIYTTRDKSDLSISELLWHLSNILREY